MNLKELMNYSERLERTLMTYMVNLQDFKNVIQHCFPRYYTEQLELDQNIRLKMMWSGKRKRLSVADTVQNYSVMDLYNKNLERQIAALEPSKQNFISNLKWCQKYDETLTEFKEISLRDNPELRKRCYEHNRKVILGEIGSSFRHEHYCEIYDAVQSQYVNALA